MPHEFVSAQRCTATSFEKHDSVSSSDNLGKGRQLGGEVGYLGRSPAVKGLGYGGETGKAVF